VARRRSKEATGSAGGEGGDQVLQLEEETGEVRRGPKGAYEGGAVELTEGGEEATAVA
jgi:hypothetical protein